MFPMCFSTARSVTTRVAAIAAFERPSAISARTSRSRAVSAVRAHTKDARAIGETEQRLYALPAWRETPFFDDRERAALAFTEEVTLMADNHVPAAAYEEVAQQFSPGDVAALLSLIVAINAWNAVGVAARPWVPGTYQP